MHLLAKYAGLDIAGGEEGEVVDEDGLADQVPVVNVHTHRPLARLKLKGAWINASFS
jgi:hypothetical protein